ncbi:MAG: PilN domain-containing protein [bacterium]
MIQVNLLPVAEKKKRKQFLFIVLGAFLILILVSVLGWVYAGRLRVARDLTTQIAQVDQESKGYSDKIAEINDLEAREASLDALRKTLQSVYTVQKNVVFAFDQLAAKLPGDIWFTKVIQSPHPNEGKFQVTGYTFSNSALQDYLNRLQEPGSGFSGTTLNVKSISAAVGNDKQIEQFEITTQVAPE